MCRQIDMNIQYGEDIEVKTKDFDFVDPETVEAEEEWINLYVLYEFVLLTKWFTPLWLAITLNEYHTIKPRM